MTKKQKKMLRRILLAAALTLCAVLVLQFVALPWYGQLILWLIPYLDIGYDVLRKALLGIRNGEVFDENFLMAVATVGAMGCGEYAEGVAVMLFYQVGELFQSYAVGKSRRSISELMDIRPDSANLEQPDGSLAYIFSINYDITTLLAMENALHGLVQTEPENDAEEKNADAPQTITHNVTELLDLLIEQAIAKVGKPVALMNKDDKVAVVQYLNNAGAFLITKSGDKVSTLLGISKFTLYSYMDKN